MLPVALTCPLWWVARWTARMLAALAVVVAFSLGTASLPLGAMATGGVEPGPATAATAVAGSAADESAGAAVSVSVAGATAAADAAGPLPPADAPPPAEAGPPPAATPAPQRVPAGFVPTAAGPRAPPAA
ncbi:hypothetical protein [Micromonospora sp. NPDC002575]|uniref:hypothetical protein n=1 Tax=Micromonospora sp. NPDC002575 TaxID=3364222 RepID=UPI00367A5250